MMMRQTKESLLNQQMGNETMNDLPTLVEEDENTKSSHLSDCKELDETDCQKMATRKDGIIIKNEENQEFSNQISPILKTNKNERMSTKRRIEEDTIDNISINSSTISLSYKKPKLMRTGSITKGLRKSLSFGMIKTPINNIFKSRRNSVDPDISASASMISIDSTFNETISRPIKEKFRRIKEKVSKMTKKDHFDTPKAFREKSFAMQSDNLNESNYAIKTPEKNYAAQVVEPKTPKFLSDFQLHRSADVACYKNKQFSNDCNLNEGAEKFMVIIVMNIIH
jgi:hypothetical protein